jgi:aspartate/methionine/tyrosine aminotransferase
LAETSTLPDPKDHFGHVKDARDDEFKEKLMKMYVTESRRDYRIAYWLTSSVNVGVIPMAPFYNPKDDKGMKEASRWVRFAFCKSSQMIKDAGDRLERRCDSNGWKVHGV